MTESQRAKRRAYYATHKEKVRAYISAWRKAHPEVAEKANKKYRAKQKRLRRSK